MLILLDDDILIKNDSIFKPKFGELLGLTGKVILEFSSGMVICLNSLMIKKKVIRRRYRTGSKWSVTKDEYENDVYPNFCNGPGAAYTRTAAEKISQLGDITKSFVLEDVFVNGILRRKADIAIYFLQTIYVPNLSWQRDKVEFFQLEEKLRQEKEAYIKRKFHWDNRSIFERS